MNSNANKERGACLFALEFIGIEYLKFMVKLAPQNMINEVNVNDMK